MHHHIQKDFETAREMNDELTRFSSEYDSQYCYGLALGISEEPSLVEEEDEEDVKKE